MKLKSIPSYIFVIAVICIYNCWAAENATSLSENVKDLFAGIPLPISRSANKETNTSPETDKCGYKCKKNICNRDPYSCILYHASYNDESRLCIKFKALQWALRKCDYHGEYACLNKCLGSCSYLENVYAEMVGIGKVLTKDSCKYPCDGVQEELDYMKEILNQYCPCPCTNQ